MVLKRYKPCSNAPSPHPVHLYVDTICAASFQISVRPPAVSSWVDRSPKRAAISLVENKTTMHSGAATGIAHRHGWLPLPLLNNASNPAAAIPAAPSVATKPMRESDRITPARRQVAIPITAPVFRAGQVPRLRKPRPFLHKTTAH